MEGALDKNVSHHTLETYHHHMKQVQLLNHPDC